MDSAHRYPSDNTDNSVSKCGYCDNDWDGEITVEEKDAYGNPVETPICKECHDEQIAADEWAEKMKQNFRTGIDFS